MSSPKAMNTDIFGEAERKPTNVSSLYVKGVFLLILIGLIGYCYAHLDIKRLEIGYDDCGNVCGSLNEPEELIACKGGDKTNDIYLMFDENGTKRCTASCELNGQFTPSSGHQCLNASEKHASIIYMPLNFTVDLKTNIWEILITMQFTSVISVLVLFLIRHFSKLMVWITLLAATVFFIAMSALNWKSFSEQHHWPEQYEPLKMSLLQPIIWTLLTVPVPVLVFIYRREIHFTIRLWNEACQAVIDMSLLMFIPFGTAILLFMATYLWIKFFVVIESAGILTVVDGKAEYVSNGVMGLARVLNCIGFVWFSQFLFGCQHLIVSGAVGKWFFTRAKVNTNDFVVLSTKNLVRFHLGTAIFGSLVGINVSTIRTLIMGLWNKLKNRGLCVAIIGSLVDSLFQFLEYLSDTAYICTAMFGYPFFQAGKKAFDVIMHNGKDLLIVKTVGNIVTMVVKILITICAFIFGYTLLEHYFDYVNDNYFVVVLALLTYQLAHCFISVLEVAMDTVFISLCEDCERKVGRNNLCFMSPKMVKLLEDMSVLKKLDMECL